MGKQRMLLQTEFLLLINKYIVEVVLCKEMLNGVSLSTAQKLFVCTQASMHAVTGKAKNKE
jgi:hypothetical protein